MTQKIEDDKEEKDTMSTQGQIQDNKSTDELKQGGTTNIQEQRKALLERQRQLRFEKEKQMGVHTGETSISSSDPPLKSSISGSKGTKATSGAPKRVRFVDEEQVNFLKMVVSFIYLF